MESDRFDRMARAIAASTTRTSTRRGALKPLSALGVAALMAFSMDASARKKRKKKKCKGGSKKCGKKCIPASTCCTNPDCGNGGACIGGACICLNGFKECQGACIPEESCCTSADCPHEGVCESGECVAPFCAGHNECAGTSQQCQVAGASTTCFCLILEGSSDPFCGLAPRRSTPCTACTGEERCVNLTGCGDTPPTGCASPCPNPR